MTENLHSSFDAWTDAIINHGTSTGHRNFLWADSIAGRRFGVLCGGCVDLFSIHVTDMNRGIVQALKTHTGKVELLKCFQEAIDKNRLVGPGRTAWERLLEEPPY